jgi:hypothetical protein
MNETDGDGEDCAIVCTPQKCQGILCTCMLAKGIMRTLVCTLSRVAPSRSERPTLALVVSNAASAATAAACPSILPNCVVMSTTS